LSLFNPLKNRQKVARAITHKGRRLSSTIAGLAWDQQDEMTTMTGIIYLIIHSGLDAQEFRSDYF
jgi:hypothetical protein